MLTVKTVLKHSPIHGLGCFAGEDIKKGQVTWRFTHGMDLVFTEAEYQAFPQSFKDFLKIYAYIPINEKENQYILCIDHGRHMNHSEDPSVLEVDDCNVAARDIKMGEELTCDYRKFDKEFAEKLEH